MIDEDKSMKEVFKVLSGESNFYITTTQHLNQCINHIFQLITDAYTLYINNSFSSSVFLSIAVIEEVAKVHMGLFVKGSSDYVPKDKLRDHKLKEIIGVNYTVSMGERLKKAIGMDALEKIYDLAYSGKLKNLREASIYCDRKNDTIITPDDVIDKKFAKNLLLFAIESFDDNLVGYSLYSMAISDKTDELFETIANIN